MPWSLQKGMLWTVALLLSLAAGGLTVLALPATQVPQPRLATASSAQAMGHGLQITGSTPHRLLLFSFDDGPDWQTTPKLLNRLDAEGIRAVFFLVASRLRGDSARQRQHARIARDIARRGHWIGNHTADHVLLTTVNNVEAERQIVEAEAILERALGHRTWLLRPPGGAHSPRVDALIEQRGYTTMLWNLGAGDAQVHSAEQVFVTWQRVLERREKEHGERGGVVLLHDTHPWSVDAFELIVSEVRRRNCRLMATGDELYDILDSPLMFHQPRDASALPGRVAPPLVLDRATLERRQAKLRLETQRRCRWMAHAAGGV